MSSRNGFCYQTHGPYAGAQLQRDEVSCRGSKFPRGTPSPTSLHRKESRRNSDRLPATTAIVARLFYHPAFYQESGEVVGAVSCQVPGHAFMEGEISDDQIIGQVFEDQDYLEKITKLQGYLDEVKRIVRESCSQEVLEVALSSISSLVTTLSSMSSSTKLHSSL